MSAVVDWFLSAGAGLEVLTLAGSPIPLGLLVWQVVRLELLHRRNARHAKELEELRAVQADAAHRLGKVEVRLGGLRHG